MKEFIVGINLFLFAFSDNQINVTTQDSLSAEMKTFYDMTLIDMAQPNLVHDQFGQKRPIPQGSGKIIEFRKYAPKAKALTPLTEGVPPRGEELAVSTITSEVHQYGAFTKISDVLDLTAIDNNILEATKLHGQQAGQTLDTITRNILHTNLNASYASKWSGTTEVTVNARTGLDATAELKVDTIFQAATKLRAANAPTINGDYVGIIHPYVAYSLMRDPEWIDAHKYAEPDNIYTGEIGKIGGVRFVSTTEAKIYDGEGIALGKNASGGDVYQLSVNHSGGYSGAITSVAFDGATVQADALIGLYLRIGNAVVLVTDNTASTITFASTNITVADNAPIMATDCAAGSVFGTLILGADAYGVTEVTGGGLETIVHQRNSGGVANPLNQYSTVGWKAIKTAEILIPEYIVRIESCSGRYSATARQN